MAPNATVLLPHAEIDVVLPDAATDAPVSAWVLQTLLGVIVSLVTVASFAIGYHVG